MDLFAFAGGFLAVSLILTLVILLVRRKIRAFSRKLFGTQNILEALNDISSQQDQGPRSLNGCDSLLIPQILRDFPDFDHFLAKTYAQNYLRQLLKDKDSLVIHNTVISRYLPSAAQKTIVFQSAVSWLEKGIRQQKRFELNYTYLLPQTDTTVAANCPNCGGALGYGITVCPYCDSRVSNVLGNTWQFTQWNET